VRRPDADTRAHAHAGTADPEPCGIADRSSDSLARSQLRAGGELTATSTKPVA
jgi:hypothetical protein